MAYVPTTWVEKATTVGPTNMNHLENGLQAAAAVADAALPTPAGSNGQFLKKVGGVWVPTSFAVTDIPAASIDQTYMAAGNKITAGAVAAGPPASPITGDIWIATAVDANGTSWMFRYDSTQTTYKWVFVGGAPLLAGDGGTNASTTSASFVEVDTNCRITVARAGDYAIHASGRIQTSTTANTLVQAGIGITTSLGSQIIGEARINLAAVSYVGYAGYGRLVGLSAAAIICQAIRNGSADGSTITYGFRNLSVVPVRVI